MAENDEKDGYPMPAKSKKQEAFMRACANNPRAVRGECPPKDVAKEFIKRGDEDRRKNRGGRF